MTKNQKKLLDTKIDKFISMRRKSKTGGWAEVTDCDIDDLSEIINDLLELKFERDCDNDLPVEFCLVDRNKHYSIPYVYVPYERMGDVIDGNFERYFDSTRLNWEIASTAFNQALKLQDFLKRSAAGFYGSPKAKELPSPKDVT